jgi:hypothetical protein
MLKRFSGLDPRNRNISVYSDRMKSRRQKRQRQRRGQTSRRLRGGAGFITLGDAHIPLPDTLTPDERKKCGNLERYFRDMGKSLERSDMYMDAAWMILCNKHIAEMDMNETYMISAYTTGGDKIINTFLRNGENTTAEMIEEQVAMFRAAEYYEDVEDFDVYELSQNLSIPYLPQIMDGMGVDAKEYFDQPYVYKIEEGNENVNMNGLFQLNNVTMVTKEGFALCKDEFESNEKLLGNYLKEYIADLQEVLTEAPKSKHFIKVYRGIPKDFQAGEVGSVIAFPFFMSTTVHPHVAHQFMRQGCCLYEFICHPDSKKLAIGKASVAEMTKKSESEILFAKDTRGLVLTNLRERVFDIEGIPRKLQVRTILLF